MIRNRKNYVLGLCVMVGLMLMAIPVAAGAAEGTNWALGATYRWSMAPSDQYPDIQGKQLTDGVYGENDYKDEAWMGHLRNDFRVITIDLGQVRPIREIRANFLQNWAVGIRYPEEVIVEVSRNGASWEIAGSEQVNPGRLGTEGSLTRTAVFSDLSFEARYVRITVLVDVWMFMDEVEVIG